MNRLSFKLIICVALGTTLSCLISLQSSLAYDTYTPSKALLFRTHQNFPEDAVIRGKKKSISHPEKQLGSEEQNQAVTREAIQVEKVVVDGVPILKSSIDLNDPDVIFTVVPVEEVEGAGGFTSFVRSRGAALVTNTTFEDAEKLRWTTISQGTIIEGEGSVNWSTGTVLTLGQHNAPEMINRVDGLDWSRYWFSITCLPRLLRDGVEDIFGSSQYLDDSGNQRSAIGFSRSTGTLYHVITEERHGRVPLPQLARIMQSLGCDEAMNLEGGDGVLLAHGTRIFVNDVELHNQPVRAPVIVVYDKDHPAPADIKDSWEQFNNAS